MTTETPSIEALCSSSNSKSTLSAPNLEIYYTEFETVEHSKGVDHGPIYWDEFKRDYFSTPTPTQDKLHSGLWAPVICQDNKRGKKYVEKVYLLGLDFDNGAKLAWLTNTFKDYDGIIHSTFSHMTVTESHPVAVPTWRVILPLSRPVTLDEHVIIWEYFRDITTNVDTGKVSVDKACRDASRIWVKPLQNTVSNVPYERHELSGQAIDIDAILALQRSKKPTPKPLAPVVSLATRKPLVGINAFAKNLYNKTLKDLSLVAENRNAALNKASMTIGGVFDSLGLDEEDIKSTLYDVAIGIGLQHGETISTINSGFEAGLASPLVPKDEALSEPKNDNDPRSKVIIDLVNEDIMINNIMAVLSRDETTYTFGYKNAKLVTISNGSIELLDKDIIRSHLSKIITWHRISTKGTLKPAVLDVSVIKNIVKRNLGKYNLKQLEGIVVHPIQRKDGSFLLTEGYDDATKAYYAPDDDLKGLTLPDNPTLDDAKQAVKYILDEFSDFPFESEAYKSTFLCALLTPFTRYAFDGCAPFMMIEAAKAGTGKSLLGSAISIVSLGIGVDAMALPDSKEEQSKTVTSTLLKQPPIAVFDNIDGDFGGAIMESLITGETWNARLLGGNTLTELPNRTMWMGTSNNCSYIKDMYRRICSIKLLSNLENPEDRDDFKHENIKSWVIENRRSLITACLIILKAYSLAGAPRMGSKWGSFEGWARAVADCVVWAGMVDPAKTKIKSSDTAGGIATTQIVQALDMLNRPLLASEILDFLNDYAKDVWGSLPVPLTPTEKIVGKLLVENIGPCVDLTVDKIGRKLRNIRNVPIGNRRLVKRKRDRSLKTIEWFVQDVSEAIPTDD